MKVSVVIPILDSHEVVRRQILHFTKMNLPDDVEFVFVDDGSDPPLNGEMKNLRWVYTNDKRPWTHPLAKKRGVEAAQGEYLLCTDIDHIVTRELIDYVRNSDYDVIYFRREAAVLDENGDMTQDHDILREYGLGDKFFEKNLNLEWHTTSYAMKREFYLKLGGGREDIIMQYPTYYEVPFRTRIRRKLRRHRATLDPNRPMIYMIPNGHFCGNKDADPKGLFHKLTRN